MVREGVGMGSLSIKLLPGQLRDVVPPHRRAVLLALLPLIFLDFVTAHVAESAELVRVRG